MEKLIYLGGGFLFIIVAIVCVVVMYSFIIVIKFLRKKNYKLLVLFSGIYLLISCLKILTIRLDTNKIYYSNQIHLLNNLSIIPSDATSPSGGLFTRLTVAVGELEHIPQLDFINYAYPAMIFLWWIITVILIPLFAWYIKVTKNKKSL